MKRIEGLDALRGIAAVSVVLFHYTTRFEASFGHPSPPPFNLPQGFRGVDLFFVISGFVIFMTLDKARDAREFLVSRFARLFPTFWAAVAATFTVVSLWGLPGKEVSMRDLALNFTMLPGLLHARAVDGAYWTLEVELFFYAAMLALFCTGLLRHIRLVLLAWLALRLVTWQMESAGWHVSYLFGHLLILSHIALFGTGMMLYRLHRDAQGRAADYAMLAACLSVVAITGPVEALVVPVLASLAILMLSRGRLAFLSHPALVFLGTISYPLYLLHENIGFVILRGLYAQQVSPGLAIGITFAAMVACAWAVSFTIEQPARRWIRNAWGGQRPLRQGAVAG